MTAYNLTFDPDWYGYFGKLDLVVRKRVFKKALQLQGGLPARHLRHGLPYFVVEAGQYRICFTRNEQKKEATLLFAGTHKDYEKWLREKA